MVASPRSIFVFSFLFDVALIAVIDYFATFALYTKRKGILNLIHF
jgi:hypothetical protein